MASAWHQRRGVRPLRGESRRKQLLPVAYHHRAIPRPYRDEAASSVAARCNVCHRELNASDTTPCFYIDVNRDQVPQTPALLRPRRKVVANGNCRALASRRPDTPQLSPRARMTGFASIATGSGRLVRDQVVCTPINGGGDTAPLCRHSSERVVDDVPFN